MVRRRPRATDGGVPAERGFALIVVLWFLVLLAVIGTHVAAAGRTEIYIARNTVAAARAEALAEAGVFQAVYALSDPTHEKRWDADGEAHHLALAGGEITVTATDETAKIDPNTASQPIVEALFVALGLDADIARAIAGGINQAAHPAGGPGAANAGAAGSSVNFVAMAGPSPTTGTPGQAPQNGVPGQAQQGQATQTTAPQGPVFETLGDLLQVAGMTPEILAQARPYLTVDSGLPKPTPTHADAIVRRALEIAGGKTGPQNAATPAANNGGGGLLVDIVATARSGDGATFVREAIVRIDATSASGFSVLRWQRRAAAQP